MSLMSKLKKASKIGHTAVLSESTLFGDKEFINTGVPMINVALSGDLSGGLGSGLTVVAGMFKIILSMTGLASLDPLISMVQGKDMAG